MLTSTVFRFSKSSILFNLEKHLIGIFTLRIQSALSFHCRAIFGDETVFSFYLFFRTMQRKPRWQVEVSMGWGMRAAGR